jgi:hypothetical protein
MSTVRELHDKAMNLAHLAMVARQGEDWERAETLARQAYEFEMQAAKLIPEDQSSEPTRSILYRSAASLAYQCKEFVLAQRLIAKGLSGYPPPQVEQELKDLYEQMNFERHLEVRGAALENEAFQMSLEGRSVGHGMVMYDEFFKRIRTAWTLIDRTMQRKMGAPYQRAGRVAKNYRPFIPALSETRAGSFAITIRLAVIKGEQIPLPLITSAEQVIEEVITGIELINNGDQRGLRERIPQDSYFRNFLALTRDMAPDGDRINFVGFSSLKKVVGLTRHRNRIEIAPQDFSGNVERTPIRVEGILDYASARRHKEAIGLTTEDGIAYKIVVQEGLEDLVRVYFKQLVIVTGLYDRKQIYLEDVQSSEG